MNYDPETPRRQQPSDPTGDSQPNGELESGNDSFPEYPEYPMSEDIYNKAKKAEDLSTDDLSLLNETAEMPKNRLRDEEVAGNDLDIPGAELDDTQEISGNEDEENNYYSLGGDRHED